MAILLKNCWSNMFLGSTVQTYLEVSKFTLSLTASGVWCVETLAGDKPSRSRAWLSKCGNEKGCQWCAYQRGHVHQSCLQFQYRCSANELPSSHHHLQCTNLGLEHNCGGLCGNKLVWYFYKMKQKRRFTFILRPYKWNIITVSSMYNMCEFLIF